MDGRGDQDGAVAIIGMACRFPGAQDPAEFHELLVAGRRMFQPVDALRGRPLHAALLDDWVPPVSFGDPGLGPHDLGPVQKLAAEMTALALTDAGLLDVAGSTRTGLLIASVTPSLCDLVRGEFGCSASGPYPPAAYASSLHAVTAAADALQAGDLDLAVAGGVELGIDPVWLALQARAGTLATAEMRVYAADPAGLLPGEGCAMVVLARSADARAAGVPVYAEIAGWSTPRVMAPAGAAETSREAYRQAGIDPADIQLAEGQGTGTAAGDTAELAALAELRRGGTAVAALGAASASIGYAKAAAGIASLVKTALAMAAGTIPPGTGSTRPHPLIESGEALLRMPAGGRCAGPERVSGDLAGKGAGASGCGCGPGGGGAGGPAAGHRPGGGLPGRDRRAARGVRGLGGTASRGTARRGTAVVVSAVAGGGDGAGAGPAGRAESGRGRGRRGLRVLGPRTGPGRVVPRRRRGAAPRAGR